ncbi:MAG: hypothetical protein ACPGQS_02120 [Bradymonadia bacterium]
MEKRGITAGFISVLVYMMICLHGSSVLAKDLRSYVQTIKQTEGWYLTESAIVGGSDVRSGIVYSLIDASHDHLLAILRDYKNYPDLIHFLNTVKVIKTEANQISKLRLKAKILNGAVKLRATVVAREVNHTASKTTITLRKQSGNLNNLDASFTIEEYAPGRSVVQIQLMLDPDLWYVSDSTLSDYNQVNARRITRALKKNVLKRQPPEPPIMPAKKPLAVQPTSDTKVSEQKTSSPPSSAQPKEPATKLEQTP